jgi:adenosyl cobinamide kinase/adenosyl cobinamide phosphate guanylyltransferase
MTLLNIAMGVFFTLLGVAVCYIAEEHKFDACVKDWAGMHEADIEQQWKLRGRIRELEKELESEREEHYLTKE